MENNKPTFDENTVYIIDSYGLIFRAYFAFISRPLTNSKGQNVSALFGFFRNLHWVLQHYKPGYIFAAMDSKTKTFRHEMYPEYKATRNKTPDDLHAQIPWICDTLQALGIPVLQCDGYEADDVIATVARKCQETGRTCRILSGDKDLMQLVTETTQILKPETGASTWKVTGPDGVEAEWGVPPEKLLDLLSLYGDTADNVPGVHGVGVKTAAKLLTDYGDLDGIYANVENIKGAMQQKLKDGRENAYFSQKLIRLCDTVPCPEIDAALSSAPLTYNYKAAADILHSYEVLAVAKSYAELALTGGGSDVLFSDANKSETKLVSEATLPLAPATEASSATPSAGTPRNAPGTSASQLSSASDSAAPDPFAATSPLTTPALNLTQNDTSNYRALTTINDLDQYISEFLKTLVSTSSTTPTPNSDFKTQNSTPNSELETQNSKLTTNNLQLTTKNSISYDSETTGLDTQTCAILGFSLCYKKGEAVYIPLQQETSADLFSETNYITKNQAFTQLARLFNSKDVTVIMHNAKFDMKVLMNQGFEKYISPAETKSAADNPVSLFPCQIHDTMLLAWLQNPERTGKSGYSLEYLGETRLGLKGIEFSDIVPKGQTFADVPLEQAYRYAAEDADFTLQLYQNQTAALAKAPAALQQTYAGLLKLELQVLPILTRMELTGIHLDSQALNSYNEELTRGIALAEQNIYKEVGHEFNIASPKQLQTVLFEERKLPAGKKTKTGYSTDTSVLEELAAIDPVPKMILEYREMAKLQSTYVETLPKLTDTQGRIHTDFVQTGTATGRLSCREPNLQNIPVRSEAGRRIRSAFTAPEGKVLISADYAQIELVVLAHLSGDKNMCQAFTDGTDVHKATAALIYGVTPDQVQPDMRRIAKTINFGVIYGMSAFSLAKDLGISRTQAQNFIESYFRTYSSVSCFMSDVISKAEQTGYVETILGRRRPIVAINSRNKVEKSAAERVAKNTPIQGSAADIVKTAMVNVATALKETNSPARLLLQVHDELIFECPDDQATIDSTIALIRDKMEHAVQLKVPLRVSVEYGKNWGEFH